MGLEPEFELMNCKYNEVGHNFEEKLSLVDNLVISYSNYCHSFRDVI